jgi:uncharacterized membrane protein YozB (DUF420 family)
VDVSFLPTVNALLNTVAASLLVVGRQLARRKRIAEHRRVMLTAFAVSTLFLVLYVTHKLVLGFESTTFYARGPWRLVYLVFLFSHVLLAMLVPVLAVGLVSLGLLGKVERHRRMARFAWPVWMYVSVTGVVIYVLLYHLNPAP